MYKSFFDTALYLYMGLLAGCCLLTLYPAFSPLLMAFMTLLWGLLGAGTVLWMLERVHEYQKRTPQTASGRPLPDSLLYNMHRQNSYSRGVRATKAYSLQNVYLLVALFIYVAWGIWVTSHPVIPPALQDLNEQIVYAFRLSEGFEAASYRFLSLPDIVLRNILPLCVLALAFGLGQVFGHSSRAGEVLVWLCFGLFAVMAALLFMFSLPVPRVLPLDLWHGYGWGRRAVLQALEVIPAGDLSALQRRLYTLGLCGVILGYLPGVIAALVLLRNAFTKGGSKIKGIAGWVVLSALLVVDILYPLGAAAFGLHLAGWSALAFLTIRRRTDMRKIYRLYQ